MQCGIHRTIHFKNSQEQLDTMTYYKKIFEDDTPGLTRTLSRVRITEFYRIPV